MLSFHGCLVIPTHVSYVSYVRIWRHHPIETTMLKWMSQVTQVLKCGAAVFFLPDFARKSFPITCDFLSHVKIEEDFFKTKKTSCKWWWCSETFLMVSFLQDPSKFVKQHLDPSISPHRILTQIRHSWSFWRIFVYFLPGGRPLRTESHSSESPNGWKFRWKMDPNFPSQEFPTHFNNNAENLRVDLFWGGRFCFVYPMFSSPKEEEQSDFHSRHVVTKIQDDQLSST